MSPSICPTCGILSESAVLRPTTPLPRELELLSVNTPPLDSDAAALRAIIQKSSEEIEFAQSQFMKAQERLSALITLKSRSIADAKKILHPMRSLPLDILAEIFLSCAPNVDQHTGDSLTRTARLDSLSPGNHPWTLSHVSRRWREIALSLPRLWSVIYLNFSRYTKLSSQRSTFMGSLLLERSAKLDLCVNIVSGEKDIVDHALTRLLKETTTRWRILNTYISSPSLQCFSGCQFSSLEELGVQHWLCDYPVRDPDVDTFKDLQNIRTVNLHRTSSTLESFTQFGEFPWKKVLKLSCRSYTLPPALLPVLQQSTGLEELMLKFLEVSPAFHNFRPHSIMLPALERLKVMAENYYSSKQTEALLRILRTPAIRYLALILKNHFALSFPVVAPHPDWHRIQSLHIACSMKHTSRDPNYIGGARTLLNFLRPMSGVEEFELEDDQVPSEFLQGLVVDGVERGTVLFPALRTLDLHECRFENRDTAQNLLLCIAESRSAAHDCPSVPLERMILPEEKWLKAFKVDGVEVVRVRKR